VAARQAVGEACARAVAPIRTVLLVATGEHADVPGLAAAAADAAGGARLVGAVSSGVVAGGAELESGPGVAALAFGEGAPVATPYWIGGEPPATTEPPGAVVVFADGSSGAPEGALKRLAATLPEGTPIVGTIAVAGTAGAPLPRFVDQATSMSRPAGLLLARAGEVIVGVAEGCQPVGPSHEVTTARGNVIERLDGRPAFEVFAARARPLLDDLPRAAQTVFLAIDDPRGREGWVLRGVIGFDPKGGLLAVSGPVAVGNRLRFALREGATARAGLHAMLDEVKTRLGGRRPRLALWFASAGRGRALFGVPDHDAAFLGASLGDVPVVGLLGGSEIAPASGGEARLHVFSGVLVVA